MKKLLNQLAKLQNHIVNQRLVNTTVSASSVGWHIEHCLLVINQVIATVENSNPEHYKNKFSFLKLVIFTTQKLPRGKVKAPKQVQPKNDINEELLKTNIQLANTAIEKLQQLQPNKHFEHPMFGKLNVKQTIKFLYIHTAHHLHIIDDIVNTNK